MTEQNSTSEELHHENRQQKARIAELERELADRNTVPRSRYKAVCQEVETLESTLESIRQASEARIAELDRDLALWRNAWSAQADTIREFERQFAYQVQRARKLAELVDFDVLETFRKTMPDDMPEDWKP